MGKLIPLVIAFFPVFVLAQETGNTVSFELIMHGLIGAFGAVSVVVFVAGFIVYLTRLGTERREEGIGIMEWGVSIMVVVVLCAGVLYWMNK